MAVPLRHRYEFAEYIRLEKFANVRHEYLDGEIYAMAGGSPDHAAIAMNVGASLSEQLRGQRCRVFSSDLRVRVPATGLTTYPDITVVCDRMEHDPQDENTVINPVLVVEVLSPSTEAYDRGEKLEHYKQLVSLEEILLVAQNEHLVEHWRRKDDSWVKREHRFGEVELSAVPAKLLLVDVYRNELAES